MTEIQNNGVIIKKLKKLKNLKNWVWKRPGSPLNWWKFTTWHLNEKSYMGF